MSDEHWYAAKVQDVGTSDYAHLFSNVFFQWKGTDACFDFSCSCGGGGHFDGYFAHQIKCGDCGAVYAMPATIAPLRITEDIVNPVVVSDVLDDQQQQKDNNHE